ncbi:hypothetical protein FB45DRAFT_893763 [Roridomyces roridus]|uniref:Uncharacterized protein n=1 Tax=Roridomyces roridus TaxID=1738132 RepID=A0AAD7CG17_9AGAR|nr:hypothetical protein FB45DRAFT_893763 [Roridomyces roridus]
MHIPQQTHPTIHLVRDCRGEVVGQLDSPSALAGLYPDLILQMAARLEDEGTPDQYDDLWELILTHWFPSSEGYTLHRHWQVPYLRDRDGLDKVTIVVKTNAGIPVVLLDISPPRGFDNWHSRAAAQALSTDHFEHVAPYYDYPLCAISAMGKKWTAFQSISSHLTAHEARAFGEENIDWMEDIVSEPSYEMLERFFAVLKERIQSVSRGVA